MNDFKYKMSQFMQGRYGMDQLYYALLALYLILLGLNVIFRRLMIFSVLSWFVLFFAFYRFFSRDIARRSRENDKFMAVWGKVTGGLGNGYNAGSFGDFDNVSRRVKVKGPSLMTKIREFPDKKYTTCPNCNVTLRLPRQRGKHTVRCPRCNNRFGIKIIVGRK